MRIGMGPTPMLYYATVTGKSDAGVQITGSHNPPQYNGLKIMAKGKAFYGQDILALGRRSRPGANVMLGQGLATARYMIFDDYIARLAADYELARRDGDRLGFR